jgi:hypothetical protein
MPYTVTRRLYSVFGRKISKFLSYKKAKRMYNEINRDMSFLEARFLKSRVHHA